MTRAVELSRRQQALSGPVRLAPQIALTRHTPQTTAPPGDIRRGHVSRGLCAMDLCL